MPDPIDVVIDILHHNGNVNLGKAAVTVIMSVIQKATQGQAGADPTHKTSRRKAAAAGQLWGAYQSAATALAGRKLPRRRRR